MGGRNIDKPFFAENGSVYNHGSQCFLLRALAEMGDGETFSDVLNFALPLYAEYHAPDALCGAVVTAAALDGNALAVKNGCVKIAKAAFDGKTECILRVTLA